MKQTDKEAGLTKYPYARPKAMAKLMASIQDGWKPTKVDLDLIATLAIAPSKEREALYALKFIGAIDAAGATTAIWDQLKQDYQNALQRVVRERYASLFEQIPLKLIVQESVVNFFMKTGTVKDTAEYQGMLFGWLCREAGIDLPNMPKDFHRARFSKEKNSARRKGERASEKN